MQDHNLAQFQPHLSATINQLHNILRLLNVLPIFLSPQVKRCVIITYKHGIYELPNDLRLRKLGKIRKVSKPHGMIAQCPAPLPKWKFPQYYQKNLEKNKLNFSHGALLHTKTRVSLRYLVNHCRLWSLVSTYKTWR